MPSNLQIYNNCTFLAIWICKAYVKLQNHYRCGGSILNENWVLSAGHCCDGIGDEGAIVAGTNDRWV